MQQIFGGDWKEEALPSFLFDGPEAAPLVLALAHGAGAPMDSPFMAFFAEGLAARGWRIARFEFPYMANRRRYGKSRPPDRTEVLVETWRAVVASLGPSRLVIGGKSLGGRIASMVADDVGARAVICLGYPFHPPGRPERLRLAHLQTIATPTLILQGTRDPLGLRKETESYAMSPAVQLHYLEDGDHSFAPRVASGRTAAQNMGQALAICHAFLATHAGESPEEAWNI
jgi:predicted alpha/beta-hydrolase family hydrolase